MFDITKSICQNIYVFQFQYLYAKIYVNPLSSVA